MKCSKLLILCGVFLFSGSTTNAKFDGIVLGASVGGNISTCGERSVSDTAKQLGANGKLYLGLGKSFLDVVFLGGEIFTGYDFLADPEDKKGAVHLDKTFKWGAYFKGGIRPTENLLIYGLFGLKHDSSSAAESLKSVFKQKEGAWGSIVGAGMEYAVGIGVAVRLEGLYEIEQTISFQDLPNLEFNKNQIGLNVGVLIYL